MTFTVESNSFKDGDYLAQAHILSADFGHGCDGGNHSPHLAWSGAPVGTKSFAVTLYDPDAPTGSGFWHWVVVNIPAQCHRACARRRKPTEPEAAAGSTAGPHRFRSARLRRPVPTRGRPSPPLSVYGVCGRRGKPASEGRCVRRRDRFQAQIQNASAGGDHGALQALNTYLVT